MRSSILRLALIAIVALSCICLADAESEGRIRRLATRSSGMRGRGSFVLNRRSQERWTKCPQLLEETAAANVNPLKPVELVEVDINTIVPEQPKMRLNAPMVTEELVATSHPDHHMTQCNGLTTTNNDGPVNVAKCKSASQSSTLSGHFYAERAVDGIHDSHTADRCSHTDFESNPWWSVDLGAVYNVKTVRITGVDAPDAGGRLNPFNIKVGDQYCAKNLMLPLGQTGDFECDNAIQGQSVTIEAFGGHRSIQLCQVEVFEEEVFEQGQSSAVKLENPDANTGKYCEPANDIKTEAECRVAAASIDGISFNLAYNGPHDHAYCFFLHGSVYFNTASKETSRTLPRPDAQSICAQSIGSCYDGQIQLNDLSAAGASKEGLSSEHNIIKGYRNMEACNDCTGPGPSQCTSCPGRAISDTVLVGWRPAAGDGEDVSFVGACRRYDVLGNGEDTLSGHQNWRSAEGHAKADGTITQTQVIEETDNMMHDPEVVETSSSLSVKWEIQATTVALAPIASLNMVTLNMFVKCALQKTVYCPGNASDVDSQTCFTDKSAYLVSVDKLQLAKNDDLKQQAAAAGAKCEDPDIRSWKVGYLCVDLPANKLNEFLANPADGDEACRDLLKLL